MSIRLLQFCVLAGAAGAVGCGGAQPVQDRDQLAKIKRVAVLRFSAAPEAHGADPGDAVASALTERIQRDWSGVKVVERGEIKRLLEQQKLSDVGIAEDVRSLGKALGVDAIILGDVFQYGRDRWPNTLYDVGAVMRVVDITNGRVIYTKSAHTQRSDSFAPCLEDVTGEMLRPLVAALR